MGGLESEREIDVSVCGGGRQRLLVSWEHCNNNNSSVCMYVCVSDRVNELEWKWGCVMAHKSDEMTSPLLQRTAAIAAKNTLLRYLTFYFLWSEVSARLSGSPLISSIYTMTALSITELPIDTCVSNIICIGNHHFLLSRGVYRGKNTKNLI